MLITNRFFLLMLIKTRFREIAEHVLLTVYINCIRYSDLQLVNKMEPPFRKPLSHGILQLILHHIYIHLSQPDSRKKKKMTIFCTVSKCRSIRKKKSRDQKFEKLLSQMNFSMKFDSS